MDDLQHKKCKPCEGGVQPLTATEAAHLLKNLNDWTLSPDVKSIEKLYKFPNFYRTMSFVNAIAWIANQENHHPTLEVNYGSCLVRFNTHSIDGLSENDFICAAKVDRLFSL